MAWEFLYSLNNYQFTAPQAQYIEAFLSNYTNYYYYTSISSKPPASTLFPVISQYALSFHPDPVTPAIGTIETITEYENHKLAIKKGNAWAVQILFYEDGVITSTAGETSGPFETGTNPATNPRVVGDIGFVINHETHQASLLIIEYNSSSGDLSIQAPVNYRNRGDWYYHLVDLMAPVYTWNPWESLRGNDGQFRANLTMLDSDEIPDDISTYATFNESDFSKISNESSVWNAFLNSPVNEERTIAWNGKCKMTLTISDPVGQPTSKTFTFKFYTSNSNVEFYSFEQNIPISSTTPSNNYRDYYLTWLYDNDNQVAVFYPIGYLPQSIAKYQHVAPSTPITESQMATMYLWLMARDAGSGDPNNPYDTGTEDTGGNPSGYDGHQDDIVNVTPPSLDGTNSGMFTIYCPDETELAQIAAFLWSDNVIDNFKKYFNNFSDNIIAFYVLPYKPQNLPTKAFKVGRVVSDTITSVEYVTNRFVTIDMGELVVDDKWDSYLDFGPYTKFNIYLPGIGVQALDADDIMCPANQDGSMPSELGSTIKLEYNMDLMTGIVVCFVKINGQVRYQFSGKIGYQIPLTGETHRTLMQGFAMATAGLIGTVATGGAAAPFAAAAASAAIINAMKPDVYRGGNLSGDAASLCYKTPYLIRRMPNKPMLVDQQKFTGYQSYKTGLLSEFSGYTECEDAHVEGISCTEEERAMIIEWLRKGVIL